MVALTTIPASWKIPGPSIQVDPSQAGTPTNPKFALLTGFKLASGAAQADQVVAVGTQADADYLTGAGSMLARMFAAFFAINRSTPLFMLPLAPPAGTAATGALNVTSPPTSAGVLYLYVAGQRVPVLISASDTSANVATKIAAAINLVPTLPVVAAVDGSVTTRVNLTARWEGLVGNDIRIEANYRGFYGGEVMPAGLVLGFPTNNVLAGGAGLPDFTAGIAALGDLPYKFVGLPFNDSGSFTLWGLEYGFTEGGRWGWQRQSYGQIWSAKRDTYAGLMTYGPSNNIAQISAMAIEPQSPTPIWEWAAIYTALAALGFAADPARPLQTLEMTGALQAPRSSRFNKSQLSALANVGLAIQGDPDGGPTGTPVILREQTTYQKNAQGQADNAFEVATTLATLDEVFTTLRQAISSKFPRHKLADDGTAFDAGQAIVTPSVLKGEVVVQLRLLERRGLVENVQKSKAALIVQRSSENPDGVEMLFPPDLINGLRRVNVLGQFRLQFPTIAAA